MNTTDHPINVGNTDGTGPDAKFYFGSGVSSGGPYGPPIYTVIGSTTIAADSAGNIFLADTLNNTIRKITSAGVVTTIAGGGQGSTDGPGASAQFFTPAGVAVDGAGNVYVADNGNATIRKITPAGVVSTLAGLARSFGSADGTGSAARFTGPYGIVADATGNLYVADTGNQTIRKVTPAGVVTTFAGAVGVKGSADGNGSQARFNNPAGMALDQAGNLYVADTGNNEIRKIIPPGIVSTVAGFAGTSGSADGAGNAVRFNEPYGIAVDSAGNVYVADTSNNTIRKGAPLTGSSAPTLDILSQPQRLLVISGQSATFKIVATGTPAPTYQWQNTGVNIPGATGSTYTIGATQSSDDRSVFSVIVTSGTLSLTSSAAELRVFPNGTALPAMSIIAQPTDQTVSPGSSITFTVEVTGAQAPAYQWKKNGSNITGATASSYTIASAQAADAGNYSATVTDGANSVATTGANLTVGSSSTAPLVTLQPVAQSVTSGGNVIFTVTASGSPAPTYQWKRGTTNLADGRGSSGVVITGAATATLTLTGVTTADTDTYSVVVTNSAGSLASNLATLTVTASATAPLITLQPAAQAATSGGNVTFTVSATGSPAPTYQWKRGNTNLSDGNGGSGVTISGAATSTLTLTGVAAADADTYAVTVTNSAGSTTSSGATLTVSAAIINPGRLTNLSVLTDITAAVPSFTVATVVGGGAQGATKALVVRAAGPALGAFGVTGTMSDPKLDLFAGQIIAGSNDNWGGSAALANAMASVGAFAFPAPASADAAIYNQALASGSYSVIVSGVGGSTGNVIAEIYDATPGGTYTAATPRLVNVSVLKQISAGGSLTLGFTIGGATSKTVLIRAIGPGLAAVGVTNGIMADPQLTLYNSSSAVINTNNDWAGDPQIAAAMTATGAFQVSNPASKDAMLLVNLAPGGYTAQASGVGSTGGLAIVEVYEVP